MSQSSKFHGTKEITMIRFSLFALAALMAFPAFAQDPVKKPATFNTIYVPKGFDSNDNVQIVGEGMFKNTCYRPAETTVQVDHEKKTITVGPVAYEYSGMCLQVVLPFDRVLDLGMLKAGTYSVIQATDGSMLGTVQVAEARTDSPDDFLYAPIDQAFLRQQNGQGEVFLTGSFSSSCMHMDQIKVSVQEKAIVVQPIAKMEARDGCLRGKFPFSKMVKVDGLTKGRYLLHVRSMNARAINNLVDLQ
jgi:hypothetical protein